MKTKKLLLLAILCSLGPVFSNAEETHKSVTIPLDEYESLKKSGGGSLEPTCTYVKWDSKDPRSKSLFMEFGTFNLVQDRSNSELYYRGSSTESADDIIAKAKAGQLQAKSMAESLGAGAIDTERANQIAGKCVRSLRSDIREQLRDLQRDAEDARRSSRDHRDQLSQCYDIQQQIDELDFSFKSTGSNDAVTAQKSRLQKTLNACIKKHTEAIEQAESRARIDKMVEDRLKKQQEYADNAVALSEASNQILGAISNALKSKTDGDIAQIDHQMQQIDNQLKQNLAAQKALAGQQTPPPPAGDNPYDTSSLSDNLAAKGSDFSPSDPLPDAPSLDPNTVTSLGDGSATNPVTNFTPPAPQTVKKDAKAAAAAAGATPASDAKIAGGSGASSPGASALPLPKLTAAEQGDPPRILKQVVDENSIYPKTLPDSGGGSSAKGSGSGGGSDQGLLVGNTGPVAQTPQVLPPGVLRNPTSEGEEDGMPELLRRIARAVLKNRSVLHDDIIRLDPSSGPEQKVL